MLNRMALVGFGAAKTGARYWRLRVVDFYRGHGVGNNVEPRVRVIQWVKTLGGANQSANPAQAFSSYDFFHGTTIANAFDGDEATFPKVCEAANVNQICNPPEAALLSVDYAYDFGSARNFKAVSVVFDVMPGGPYDFVDVAVESSANGTTWDGHAVLRLGNADLSGPNATPYGDPDLGYMSVFYEW